LNLAELFVRISADTSGLKRGAAESQQSLSRIGQAGERLNKVMLGVGAALAAAFTAQKIAAFAGASVRAAAEADVVWNRLGGTLNTVGIQFDSVRGNIERAARALEASTTIGDEEFAATLQTLVRITGDYTASMAEVETAANLAAGAQIDLNTAAQLVGKAMIGQTGTLARYGIIVGEGADAMQLLRDRFRGMAQNEANTLQGKLTQLNNAWENLREAIGDALTDASNGTSVLDQVTQAVRGATTWVEEHNEVLKTWADLLLTILTRGGKVIEWLGRQSQLAKETAWWMEPFTVKRTDMLGRDALARDTLRLDAGGPGGGGGGGRPVLTPEQIAAAEAAAERLARELELAADRSREFTEAWAESVTAALQAARDIREAKFDKVAESARALDGQLRAATERIEAISDSKFLSESKASKVSAEALANPEGLGSKLSALASQFTGLSASMGPLAVAAIALKPVFDGFREALGPAIDAVAEPLRMVGRIIGSTIAPLLKVLEEPLFAMSQLVGIIAETLRPIIPLLVSLLPPIQLLTPALERLSTVISYITEAIGHVVKGLGQFVDSLVPDRISKVGKGLAEMGQSMIDNARAFRKGEFVFGQMTEAAEKFTDTLTFGLPQGFRTLNLQLARFASSTPIPFNGAPAPSGGLSTVYDNRIINVYQQPGENQDELVRKIEGVMDRKNQRDSLTYAGNPYAYLATSG
jgi:DNA-binding ferritin-like protein